MQDKIKLSVYKNTFDKQPQIATLKAIIDKIRGSSALKKLSTELRLLKTKKEQQLFKQKKIPAITVSGVFKNGHNADDLIEHSGLIQIDIDNLNSSGKNSLDEIKNKLISDTYTCILFVSVSGLGIKIFVQIDSGKHKESFTALQTYYNEKYALKIDSKCSDTGRLCFLNNDPKIFVNENAKVFQLDDTIIENTLETNKNFSKDDLTTEIEKVTLQIEERKVDITSSYEDWLSLGFALAEELGEQGRSYFHRLSSFHPEYDPEKANRQFNYCLKSNKSGVTIKSLFYLAKRYEINIASERPKIEKSADDSRQNSNEKAKPIVFYSPILDRNQNTVDVKINYTKFNELLHSFGFQRFDVENDFIMVKIKKNIIEEVKPNSIQDTFFNYLESLPDALDNGVSKEMLIEKFNKSPETYFSKKRYSLLRPIKEYKFVCDTKDKSYVFYKNGFVECTNEGWQLKDYKDLNGFIWKNQLHNREIIYLKIDSESISDLGVFASFIFNISGKAEDRFKSLCSIIGYNLHTYFEGKLKATILTDSKISDVPDGRTGKSLLSTGLSKIKKVCNIKGKDFDFADKFKYQEADLDDQIITIDDARKNLDFEMMFNDITEGIKVNKKNLKPFTIRAKILITTNRTLKIEGASAKDRSIEFELADHYTDKFSPQDEFKKWFFGCDFLNGDWHLFDNFMMSCICLYLRNGVMKVSSINLNRRKLIESTNSEFVEFMDYMVLTGSIKPGEEYIKQELHTRFLNEYPEFKDDKYFSKLKNFTLCLRHFAKYTSGFGEVKKEDERKSNDKRYILFRHEKEGFNFLYSLRPCVLILKNPNNFNRL
jgi:hypothetical protein